MKKIISIPFIAIFVISFFSGFKHITESIEPENTGDDTLFPSLKAVLIVGPQEGNTASAIEKMKKIAAFFKKKGVEVESYYDDKAVWENIKDAAKDADFFIYSGHGTSLGEDGKTGGLCLSARISSKEITEELELGENAVVIFKSVCMGAGSSASDHEDIGIEEAETRVSDYSMPFFELGASCYYANNMGGGCLNFLRCFFTGETVKACYEKTTQTWAEIEISKQYKFDNTKQISIASTNFGGTSTVTTYKNGVKTVEERPSVKSYTIAFVANVDFTIDDLIE